MEVAVRLLPQAVVGLVISPLVGLVMHRVNGTVLLGVSCAALVISNLLLSMSHTRDSYFAWAFPSLILSTLGMDWTLNVGSLHILACLPFSQHSIGISLLQATTRLAIPVGIAVTTSVWSSFDGSVDVPRLQSAYTNTFVTTTALAGMALALVPFIRIGKQDEDWAYGAAPRNANSSRANRSPVCETSSVLVEKRPDRSPPRLSMMSSSLISSPSANGMPRSGVPTTEITTCSPIIWTICEECGTRGIRHCDRDNTGSPRQPVETSGTDPHRYFNDPAGSGQNVDNTSASQRKHDDEQEDSRVMRPYGRRRFPLVNRQIMTHQMLTQGFQPRS